MKKRVADYKILDLILNRCSPRALSGESITDEALMTLFEAARWAPSSYNNQPWRFIYAKRDTQQWEALLNLLVVSNKIWAQHAAVLIVVISQNNFSYNNKPSRTHSFDTGAAWENLALQATAMGLIAHGMEGFSYDRARTQLNVPDDFTVEAMIAVGKPGRKEDLPPDLQKNEEPSDRKKVTEIIFEGTFKK